MATQTSFCVFRNVSIPESAVITKAHIYFNSFDTRFGIDLDAEIYFADEDNAQPPTDKTDLEGRSVTASVDWQNIEDWYDNKTYRTPDLKDVLQEVIGRSGWAEDNNVMAILKVVDSPVEWSRFWSAEEYLGGAEKACLRVWWRPPKQIQTPLILPAEEFQISSFNVSITTYPTDANIYYTDDGTDPDEGSTLYSGLISVASNKTIKAKAYKQYWLPSEIATRDYVYYDIGQSVEYITDPDTEYVESVVISEYDSGFMYNLYLTIDPVRIRCVENSQGSWVTHNVETINAVPAGVCVDGNGYIHAVYVQAGGGGAVRYATNASGVWVRVTIDTSAFPATAPGKLFIDSNGYLHAFYTGISAPSYTWQIRYATNASGSWQVESITTGIGRDMSAVMFSDNTMAICIGQTGVGTRVFQGSWGSWSETVLTTLYAPDYGIDGYVDGSDVAHFALIRATNQGIYHVHNESGQTTWNIRNETAGTTPQDRLNGFVKDSGGKFHHAYSENGLRVKYTRNDVEAGYATSYIGQVGEPTIQELVTYGGMGYDESEGELYVVWREIMGAGNTPLVLCTIPK